MIAAFRRRQDSPFVSMTVAERGTVIALLFMLWAAVGMAHLYTADPTLLPVYLGFTCYLMALALIFVMPGFRPGIFHPVVFYVLWIGVKGLLMGQAAVAASGIDSHNSALVYGSGLNSVLALSFLLEALALLSLYVGYAVAPRVQVPTLKPFVAQGLGWKSVFWIAVSGIGVIMMLRHAGSVEMLLFQRGIASTDRIAANIGGHWVWLAGIATIVPTFWLACDEDAYKRPLFWGVVASAMAFKFLTTGSRSGTALVLIFIFFVWSLQKRRVSYLSLLAVALALLVLVGLLGEFRTATQQSRTKVLDDLALQGDFVDSAGATLQEMGNRYGVNSGQIAILAIVPEQVPHLWGESYLSMPFVFVPSVVYENKPRAGGKLVSDLIYNRPLTGIPPGAVGEAFWNFSYAGVIFVFALYGVMLRFVASMYVKNSKNPLIVSATILVFVQLEPQSFLFYSFMQALVPLLAIYGFARIRLTFPRARKQKPKTIPA